MERVSITENIKNKGTQLQGKNLVYRNEPPQIQGNSIHLVLVNGRNGWGFQRWHPSRERTLGRIA
eukprot:6053136-Karenia_brevis.AAC.1